MVRFHPGEPSTQVTWVGPGDLRRSAFSSNRTDNIRSGLLECVKAATAIPPRRAPFPPGAVGGHLAAVAWQAASAPRQAAATRPVYVGLVHRPRTRRRAHGAHL